MPLAVYPDQSMIRRRQPPLDAQTIRVLDALVEELSDDPEPWEMFVRPLLLDHHPDLLLLCPTYGVTIIEVRDWDPERWRTGASGIEHLDPTEQTWKTVPDHQADLLYLVHRERALLSRMYLTPPGQDQRFKQIRGVVVLPGWADADARRLLRTTTKLPDKSAGHIKILGRTALRATRELALGGKHPSGSAGLPQQWLDRLRQRLTGSDAQRLSARPLELSDRAKEIRDNKNGTARRRVKGPSGSGKSLALASRAATLAAQGRSVLVLSFNITLAHYLNTLIRRYANEIGTTLDTVEVMHFHGFCKRSLDPGQQFDGPDHLVELAMENYRTGSTLPRYNAILVDEGQDFELAWWNFLRHDVLNTDERNEMLLAIDRTQTIYGEKGWTDGTMPGAGFNGPPMELEGSYRLPADLIAVMYDYAREFMPDRHIDLPTVPPDRKGRAMLASQRIWRDMDIDDLHPAAFNFVRRIVQQPNFNPADLVVIASHHTGRRLMTAIEQELSIDVEHIFTEEDDEERRDRKLAFFPTVDALKGVTIHSYKGWESSTLLLCLDENMTSEEGRSDIATLVYIALTRLLAPLPGRRARILVLNAHPDLGGFGGAFGREVTVEEAEALGGQLEIPSDGWFEAPPF